MKNIIKTVVSALGYIIAGAGVVALLLWVITLAGHFKGF